MSEDVLAELDKIGLPDSINWHRAQRAKAEIERLRASVENMALHFIEYTNPGIDMDAVRAERQRLDDRS